MFLRYDVINSIWVFNLSKKWRRHHILKTWLLGNILLVDIKICRIIEVLDIARANFVWIMFLIVYTSLSESPFAHTSAKTKTFCILFLFYITQLINIYKVCFVSTKGYLKTFWRYDSLFLRNSFWISTHVCFSNLVTIKAQWAIIWIRRLSPRTGSKAKGVDRVHSGYGKPICCRGSFWPQVPIGLKDQNFAWQGL